MKKEIYQIAFRRDGPMLHHKWIYEQFWKLIRNLYGEGADRIWNGENAAKDPWDLCINCYCDDRQWEKIVDAVKREGWLFYEPFFYKDVSSAE